MDFNQSRPDPHGVQRLLDILRRQQDASSTSTSAPPASAPSTSAPSTSTQPYPPNPFAQAYPAAGPSDPTASTADPQAEAAQRRRTYNTPSAKYGISPTAEEPFDPYSFNPFSTSNPVLSHPAPTPSPPKPSPSPNPKPRDLASLSFADALPILSTLSTDKSLLRRLRTLRTQQHDLEKRLAREYRQFAATADKQYPNPKVRREQDEKRRREMLRQWDECVAKQQEELQRAGVPGVRVGKDRRETDKQRKVLGVLVEMMDDEEGGGK
ncbi:conserved hypothetical protein [Sporisorium reilianum SRZ2]|uniref:Uncharacterized protein n=1 Tax=Sporisorium reilianum (strain SRZ2) TaxID=999809 RepID=E7A1F3_SPORE|nr:conserved hypothetical protein [Sporisorium reilianum SRZ2]